MTNWLPDSDYDSIGTSCGRAATTYSSNTSDSSGTRTCTVVVVVQLTITSITTRSQPHYSIMVTLHTASPVFLLLVIVPLPLISYLII